MKTYRLQKRLAAQVLQVGQNKVWLDPTYSKEIGEAITKADIDALIKDGAIKKHPTIGTKRRAGRIRQLRKRKRRGRGRGKTKLVPKQRKREYINRIRKLRVYLESLRQQRVVDQAQYKKFRMLAKAGLIKNKQDIMARLK
jgi:large subunit ribosomal protein L19e